MINLLTTLFQTLSSDLPIHLEEAPQDSKFPYATYKLEPSITIEDNREDIPLVIDIWDDLTDSTRLENHWETLDKKLYKLRHLDENQLLIFQREGRGMIPDPDFRRRQIRYIIKRYER